MEFDDNLVYIIFIVAFIAVFFIYFKIRKSNKNMETSIQNVVCDGEKCIRK